MSTPIGTRRRRPGTVPVCGQCGHQAVNLPPKKWRAVMTPCPTWSHFDGTPLCQIPDPARPGDWGSYGRLPVWADPKEGQA